MGPNINKQRGKKKTGEGVDILLAQVDWGRYPRLV